MNVNLAGKFISFDMTVEEERTARLVTPHFMYYLQNKIADYAHAVVEHDYDSVKGQIDSREQYLIEHEKLKAQVRVLEELLVELQVPSQEQEEQSSATPGGNTNSLLPPETPATSF